jgi:hypothetical protein
MKKITSLLSLLLLFSAGIFAQSPGSGHCIGFNGSSQYGTASHPASYNVDTALTVEAWINPYSFGNNVILGTFGFNLFGAPQGYLLKVVTGGALAFESPMGTVTTPQNVLYSNDWFHIALVVNSNSLKFYVNGMLVHTAAHPGNIAGGTFPLHFGRSPYLGNPGHFHGEIDEVRIWDRAIGDLEIKAWMCKKITTGHSGYPYLVGYWRFDEGQGSAFLDSSPLVNQGTLMGQPMFGWSNAPIGDAALYSLTPPFSLHLSSTFGDTLHIDSVSGNPTAVHVYRVDLPPNFSGAPQGYSALDTTHHYGVFYVGGTPLFHGYFGFGGNAFYNGIPNCDVMLALRPGGASLFWSSGQGTPHATLRRIHLSNYPRIQMIPGRRDNPYGIFAFPGTQACVGDSISLGASSGASSYQWFLGSNPVNGANASSLNTAQAGTYTLQASFGACSYVSNPLSLTFTQAPSPSFILPSSICADEPDLPLTGGSPLGGSYFGPGVNGSLFQGSVAGTGSHLLYYSITDSIGCMGSASASITVHPAPSASVTPTSPVCQFGPSIQLSTGSPSGGTYSGLGLSSSGMFTPSVAGPGAWQYDYLVTNAFGCDDTASSTLTVQAAPITPVISGAGNTLVSSYGSGNQWYDQNGLIVGATGASYNPTATGTYYVVVTDINGCASDTSQPWPFLFVGLDAMGGDGFELHPNPARESVVASWQGGQPLEILVRDLQGRVVWRSDDGLASGIRIDMAGWAAGMYAVEWIGEDWRVVKRLVKTTE